ncbi:MAG: hypothetical protein KatS3mg051_1565 [Anaerolineae bacterium]|nr:MAG: hypothetical protein KatS3mg051_1565 [Anaerolineae bacterium]
MALSADISRIIRQAALRQEPVFAVRRLLEDTMAPYRLDKSFREDLIEEALSRYRWLRERTAPQPILQAATQALDAATQHYARMRGRIQQRIVREVLGGLQTGESRTEIEHRIRPLLGRLQAGSYTIANTALAVLDRIDSFRGVYAPRSAREAGVTRFKYVGPPPLREFCRKHWQKTYTWEEIQQLDNGQGLPAWVYGGGWNCRHRWIAAGPDVQVS